METEDHGRGGRKHHCHHHDDPGRKEQRCTQAYGRRGYCHIHGGVAVLPDKHCPRRCRERQKQNQYDVVFKPEWTWLGFVQRRISNGAKRYRYTHDPREIMRSFAWRTMRPI
jgi:hypothetical protein